VRNVRVKLAVAVAGVGALAVVAAAMAGNGSRISDRLTGYQEVPAVSTTADGRFRATLHVSQDSISYRLSYEDLEGDVQQAHIHFGQRGVNGGVVVFLCSNLNGPPGTQECPASPATIEGTIEPDDVGAGAADQGIDAGEFDELVDAIQAGVTYANVHSSKFPGGEIRGQLRPDDD
jgi:CHRD domain